MGHDVSALSTEDKRMAGRQSGFSQILVRSRYPPRTIEHGPQCHTSHHAGANLIDSVLVNTECRRQAVSREHTRSRRTASAFNNNMPTKRSVYVMRNSAAWGRCSRDLAFQGVRSFLETFRRCVFLYIPANTRPR